MKHQEASQACIDGRVKRRVLTDARKEQNRLAQRAFRQRQKEAVQKFNPERKLNHQKPRPLQPRSDRVDSSNGLVAHLDKALHHTEDEIIELNNATNEADQLLSGYDWMQVLGFQPIRHPDSSIAVTTPGEQNSQYMSEANSIDPVIGLHERLDTVPDIALCQTAFLDASAAVCDENSVSELQSTSEFVHAQEETCDLSRWSLDPSSLQVSIVYPSTPPQIASAGEVPVSSPSQAQPDAQSQSLADPEEVTIYQDHADPILNVLQFSRTSIFTASLHNARALGITIQQLMTIGHYSPFYRPTKMSDDPRVLLASARNPLYPAHLQPTLPQILYPHHAYLDLLPFPVLRARAITFGMGKSKLFEYADLKRDIVVNGGMRCWRAERGASGHAWDMRSWTVEPWFSDKWRMLLVSGSGDCGI